jgi:hypothetical protein
MIHFLQHLPNGLRFVVTVYLTGWAVRSVFVAGHDHGVSYPNGRIGRVLFRLYHKKGNPHG